MYMCGNIVIYGMILLKVGCYMFMCGNNVTEVSKVDENRCKQTQASLPCFWGMQVV